MNREEIEQHWVGMPEFYQPKKAPFKTLTVRFETQEDYEDFCGKIGQPMTHKTKSIWHPHKPHKNPMQKEYVFDDNA